MDAARGWFMRTFIEEPRGSAPLGMVVAKANPDPDPEIPVGTLELDPLLSDPPPAPEQALPSVAPNATVVEQPPSSSYPSLTPTQEMEMMPIKSPEKPPVYSFRRETTDTERAFMVLSSKVESLYNNVLVLGGMTSVFSVLCVVVAVQKFQMV